MDWEHTAQAVTRGVEAVRDELRGTTTVVAHEGVSWSLFGDGLVPPGPFLADLVDGLKARVEQYLTDQGQSADGDPVVVVVFGIKPKDPT